MVKEFKMRKKIRSFVEMTPEESATAILDAVGLSDNSKITLQDIQEIFEFYDFTILQGMTDRIYFTNQIVTLSPDNSEFANKYILAFFLYLYCYKEHQIHDYDEYNDKFFSRLDWIEITRFVSALLLPEEPFKETYNRGMLTKEEIGDFFLDCKESNSITGTNFVKIRAKFLGLVK